MRTDSEAPSLVGTLLAQRYRLVSHLGGGGMGDVYRAVNEVVNREVAIKLLRPELSRSRETVARFVREARAANAVRHPNVVDILDVATAEDGTPFLVQELLHGHDLSVPLNQRGRVSCAEALDWMIPVVDAVAAAHAQGLMHRDLKPENVFLATQPGGAVIPKVLDFGLSRSVDDRSQRVTATGVAMGTPGYMSPEQIIGASTIDVRTDVWALGVMLYELMAGVLPFTAETPGALFLRICTADPTCPSPRPPPGCRRASATWSCAASCASPRAASTTLAPWSPPSAPSAPRPPPTRRRRCPRAPRRGPPTWPMAPRSRRPASTPRSPLGPHTVPRRRARRPAPHLPMRWSPRSQCRPLRPRALGRPAAAPRPRRRPACGARRARRRRRHGHPPSAARARRRTARGRCPDAPDPAGTRRGSPRAYSARARRRRAYDPRPHGGRTVRACGPLGANRAGPDGQRPAARP